MVDDNTKRLQDWILKQTEWRGYVVRALEDINRELKELVMDIGKLETNQSDLKKCMIKMIAAVETKIETTQVVQQKKNDSIWKSINRMGWKVAGIAGATGVIVALIAQIVAGKLL